MLSEIKVAISNALATYRNTLPTECPFTVSLDFECVPFEAKSLGAWESFIRLCLSKYGEDYEYQILDFKPVDDNGNILWRLLGNGYDIGEYVTDDTEKLLKFNASYFDLLPTYSLMGIYLAENLGANATHVVIKNNEEYMLRKNEYLYIEYTYCIERKKTVQIVR